MGAMAQRVEGHKDENSDEHGIAINAVRPDHHPVRDDELAHVDLAQQGDRDEACERSGGGANRAVVFEGGEGEDANRGGREQQL